MAVTVPSAVERPAGQPEDEPRVEPVRRVLLAPRRWHTEDVAVPKLAAMASGTTAEKPAPDTPNCY